VLLAWVIVEHYSVGVLISRWALAACAVLLPAAMLAVALKAMHSRERMLAVVASVLRVVAPASILAIGPLQGWQYDWALRGILLSIVVCDGLFAAMVPSFARGTRVQGMSVRRTWGLRALAAVAVVVCALEDAVPGPPIGIFVLSAALVVWSAVEVSGIARRMRALELA
jgi:hypothetical protein